MATMLDLLKKVYPLRLAPVSPDGDRAVEYFCEELPFRVHEFPSGSDHNGWIVPQRWHARKAEIRRDGRLIYDGMLHPLGVIGYSQSFQGSVDLDELRRHLYYHEKWPNALVYHYRMFYRNWEKDWGMSMPHRLLKQLEPGSYDVDLQTVHEAGSMKVLEYVLPGASEESIVFTAHTCHAAQANDDISGCVVGVELMKRLAQRNNKYTYRLLLGPEQFCAVFYLAQLSPDERRKIRYCMYLECLGHDNRLALQKSFTGRSGIDRAALHYLHHKHPDHYSNEFREVIGNDEPVWEAPGYEIPTVLLSRAEPIGGPLLHYPQYHSSMDNEDIIVEEKLEESVDAVLGILNILESDCRVRRRFEGIICLSNPRYDLYINSMDPAFSLDLPAQQRKWFKLMTQLFRYLEGDMSILDIAIRQDLPYDEVYTYINRFREKELVEFNTLPRGEGKT